MSSQLSCFSFTFLVDVRKAAVMLIALSKTSISGVLARRRDVKESVRRAVYIVRRITRVYPSRICSCIFFCQQS